MIIKKITGNSATTKFELEDGRIIKADSEFKGSNGRITGFIVYEVSLTDNVSNRKLALDEVENLKKSYKKYAQANGDVIDWA